MKVLLINGSPNEFGCTYTALHEIEAALSKEGVKTEIFHIGNKPIRGCVGCGKCRLNGNSKCIFDDDTVNIAIEKAKASNGFVFGSPVYYASANGSMIAFLDRFFFAGNEHLSYKPGASVASARRAGTSATLDGLNKYLTITNMPVVSSQYWNMVHGNTPEEVKQDLEGLQIMRTLGKNMSWLLKCIEKGEENGIKTPNREVIIRTNFIRA